jgi:hypothetical protein
MIGHIGHCIDQCIVKRQLIFPAISQKPGQVNIGANIILGMISPVKEFKVFLPLPGIQVNNRHHRSAYLGDCRYYP